MRQQRGFSMLELVVAGLLIVILATATYRQYMNIVVDAEHAAFDGVSGWLQAGLNMRLSSAVAGRQPGLLTDLEGANPMRLLEGVMVPPSNYLGELDAQAAQQAEPGNWYFDLQQRVLVYRFRYREAMEGFERAADQRVGLRLKFAKRSADNGTDHETMVSPSGLSLVIDVTPYNRPVAEVLK
ncbi:MAG: prepilin-type N-terminal cleavage/methylation domain-containing protein [Motiliproteus sp.]